MASLVRLVALSASVIVLLGFAAFAADEAQHGSSAQLQRLDNEIGSGAPSASGERRREARHGPLREALDDANDALLAPFQDVVSSRNPWVARAVPSLLALLFYGLGLLLVANYLPRPGRESRDWRAA